MKEKVLALSLIIEGYPFNRNRIRVERVSDHALLYEKNNLTKTEVEAEINQLKEKYEVQDAMCHFA